MRLQAIALLLVGLGLLSCGADRTTGPARLDSRLEVYVHWGEQPLAGRRLEILELGVERSTDAAGIAEFLLPSGTFTLRAYVNGPGPAVPQDVTVKTIRGQTTRVEIVDCLPCVGPGENG